MWYEGRIARPSFTAELLQKIDVQQAELSSLRSLVKPDSALSDAHAALKAHLTGVHPGLVNYLDALIAMGRDRVEDLGAGRSSLACFSST